MRYIYRNGVSSIACYLTDREQFLQCLLSPCMKEVNKPIHTNIQSNKQNSTVYINYMYWATLSLHVNTRFIVWRIKILFELESMN